MKIYGIHTGSIHEGGGSKERFFKDKSKAREYALELVAEGQKECDSMKEWQRKEEGLTDWEDWKEKRPDYWEANHDCILIFEAELF